MPALVGKFVVTKGRRAEFQRRLCPVPRRAGGEKDYPDGVRVLASVCRSATCQIRFIVSVKAILLCAPLDCGEAARSRHLVWDG